MINNPEDISTALAAIEESSEPIFRHYRPLSQAAGEFIEWAKTPELRVYTGVPDLDKAMRGTAPGELTLIQGFTHSGKTLVATEMLIQNPDTPFVVFTPDETRPLVLTKLTSAVHGVSAKDLEWRIQNDDETARQLLMSTAEKYSKLAVFDDSVTLVDMDRMFDEVTVALGEKPKAVMFDYLELLEGFEDVKSKMNAMKAWGKRKGVGLFVLHQTSRTGGSGGRKMSIDSGAYGGEQQATHVIGVRRKKYMHLAQLALLEEKIANSTNPTSIQQYEAKIREINEVLIPRDKDTITVSLVKNKRPPCDLIDDTDYVIDQATGRLRAVEFHDDGYGNPIRTTKAALRYLRQDPERVAWEDMEMEFT